MCSSLKYLHMGVRMRLSKQMKIKHFIINARVHSIFLNLQWSPSRSKKVRLSNTEELVLYNIQWFFESHVKVFCLHLYRVNTGIVQAGSWPTMRSAPRSGPAAGPWSRTQRTGWDPTHTRRTSGSATTTSPWSAASPSLSRRMDSAVEWSGPWTWTTLPTGMIWALDLDDFANRYDLGPRSGRLC